MDGCLRAVSSYGRQRELCWLSSFYQDTSPLVKGPSIWPLAFITSLQALYSHIEGKGFNMNLVPIAIWTTVSLQQNGGNSINPFVGLLWGLGGVRFITYSAQCLAQGKYAKLETRRDRWASHFNGKILRLGERIQKTRESLGTEMPLRI